MNIRFKANNIIFWSFIIITILAGLYFRLKGLGKWPLAVDEYYMVKSSENILKYGLPKWDVGGYYARGLPQQYLTALLLLIGLKAEFASRIIPVIANLLAIPGLYLLAKKVSGKTLAAALVFIFTFSLWEVEFARFARMYTLFQTLFIWYMYFFYKNILEGDDKAYKWLWILSFFSIFIYEGSIFLVVLNFFPIIWDKEKNTLNPFSFEIYKAKILRIVISICIFLIACIFLKFNFRTLYQENMLPPDIVDYFKSFKSGGLLRSPFLLLETLPLSNIWLLLFLIPLGINIFALYRILKSDSTIFTKISFFILLIFSLLNFLGLIIATCIIFILIGWLKPIDFKLIDSRKLDISSEKLARGKWEILPSNLFGNFLIVIPINFIFWLVFALNTNAWYKLFPNEKFLTTGSALKTIVKESINYPYFYETYVLFRETIPIITIIVLFLLTFLMIYIFMNYFQKEVFHYRFLLSLLLFLALTQNALNLTYFETRYFFFMYPLILLLILLSLERIINLINKRNYLKKFVFGFTLIAILIFSEDFQAKHLLKIDSAEINFRMNYSFPLTIHYYNRWDSETPAKIVNKESAKDDIIITNEQTCEFYLDRLDYIFRDYRWAEFPGESVLNGTKERWTNANLIYKYPDFDRMLDNNPKRIWLLINTTWALDELNSLVNKYEKYLYHKSIDGRILLFKIPKLNHNC